MDLKEISGDVVDCMTLVQDREQWKVLLDMVMNLRVS
jgi:hypothetical protein